MYLFPDKKRYILLFGFVTSLSIELLQWLLKIGVCDIDDLLLNMAGTISGIYVYRKVKPHFYTIYRKGLFTK